MQTANQAPPSPPSDISAASQTNAVAAVRNPANDSLGCQLPGSFRQVIPVTAKTTAVGTNDSPARSALWPNPLCRCSISTSSTPALTAIMQQIRTIASGTPAARSTRGDISGRPPRRANSTS